MREEGLALKYPDVIKAYVSKPNEGLEALRSQSLLVSNEKGQEIWRIETEEAEEPFRAIIISPRVTKLLNVGQEQQASEV
jgi:hypothetical protein